MSLRILALASMASLAVAQSSTASGYGRYSCSNKNGDGTYSPLNSLCANPVDFGANDGGASSGLKSDGFVPTGSSCVRQTGAGYFCGIAGATCTANNQCDNGACNIVAGATTGNCQGGFGQVCNGDDFKCTGLLYCTTSTFDPIATCGGIGAFCADVPATGDAAVDQPIFNQYCASGYCGPVLECKERLIAGADCTADPFGCATGSTCTNGVCTATGPSQRARARRSLSNRGLCPASHTACAVGGSKAGFECIDTTSNLEQCGACASAGGVDCTALPGVEAVGCVAGQCEVWSCAEGFSWDAASASCQA